MTAGTMQQRKIFTHSLHYVTTNFYDIKAMHFKIKKKFKITKNVYQCFINHTT